MLLIYIIMIKNLYFLFVEKGMSFFFGFLVYFLFLFKNCFGLNFECFGKIFGFINIEFNVK